MTTAASQLQQIARHWPDLTDALGDRTQHAWPPQELKGYINALDRTDSVEAAALRALERNPDQLGTRPVPISLHVHDTMRAVETTLYETADQIASTNQHSVRTSHPHRWRYTGHRPGAVHTALWLSARADGVFWPGRPLTEPQQRHVAATARHALARIETTLDLARHAKPLDAAHTCQCGGTITLHAGAGERPVAHCGGCGAWWTEQGIVAA